MSWLFRFGAKSLVAAWAPFGAREICIMSLYYLQPIAEVVAQEASQKLGAKVSLDLVSLL